MQDIENLLSANTDNPDIEEIKALLGVAVEEILSRGYPDNLLGCYTEEIGDDDPEEMYRGGLTIIFTCLVDGVEVDIPIEASYEEFLAELKENDIAD